MRDRRDRADQPSQEYARHPSVWIHEQGIIAAVGQAKDRGVAIRVVLDKSNGGDKYTGATYLLNHGVPVWIDSKHAIAHNKLMMIDGEILITGSFNFTEAAEKSNAENLLVIQGRRELVAGFVKNFEAHLGHSEKYTGTAK